jgi:plastocyanin
MNRRRFLRAAAAAGVPVALAGCTNDGGDGSDGGATPTATDEPTATPTDAPGTTSDQMTPTATDEPAATDSPTATESPTATDEPTPTATATPQPDQTVVVAPDGRLRFDPASFSISTGDTVLWEWDGGGHNVSPGSQPGDASWPGDDESLYSGGHTHVYTFDVAGSYEYHCDPHQSSGMTGSFTVE